MADVTKKITVAVEAVVGNSASKLNNFVKSTKDVENNLKGVAGASDVASTALGVFTGTLAADVAKAFGSAIADIAIKIKDLGLETQQTISKIGAMKNFIGDATQAYQYFNDVGRNTTYDLAAVQQMGAQLLNMGYSAKEAADMIQLCADTAAGLNQGQAGAQQLIDTLSRIQATGEMSSRQLISLQTAGMNLDKAFASVGMSAEQAMKAMDDGTLDAQTAIQALTKYMHEFDGSMAESKNNITDMWGDVSGNVQTAMGEIGASIADAFQQSGIVQELISVTQDLVDFVRSDGSGAFQDFKDVASDVLRQVGDLLTFVVDIIKIIVVSVSDAYSAFKSFGAQVIEAVRPAVDVVLTLYDAVKSVLNAVGKSVNDIARTSFDKAYRVDPDDADSYAIIDTSKKKYKSTVSTSGGSAGGGGGGSHAPSEQERAIEALIKKYSDADKMLKNVIKAELEAAKISVSMMSGNAKLTEENTIKLTALKTAHDEVLNGYEKELSVAEKISDTNTRDSVIDGINKQIDAENKLYQAKLRYAAFEADKKSREENTASFDREMQHIQNMMNMYQISAGQRIALENGVLEARRTQLEETLAMLQPYSEEWINTEQQLADTIQQIHANAAYNVQGGWQEALREIANQQVNFKDAFVGAFGSIENSLVSLVSGTESAKDKFKRFCEDVTKTILQSMTQIIIKGLITNAIMSAIGLGGGGIGMANGHQYQSFNGGKTIVSNVPRSVLGIASGGFVTGAGTSTSDSIPAMLSNGEYVVRASAVKRIGVPRLNAINRGVPHFANGGYVGKAGGVVGAPPVVINLHNESGVALDAQQTDAKFDGESWVIGIVMNGIATNKNGMRTVLKGAMT